MTPTHELRDALQALLEEPLVYVDCGARKGKLPKEFRLLGARYVGFEGDADECRRLNASAPPGQRYVAAFLGSRQETRRFHITSSPACSSLLPPNLEALAAFPELSSAFAVERVVEIETTPLDSALAREGIPRVDFLELDTQGSELEILEGAAGLLRTGIAGVKVEVEFSPMYVDQPLYADIDTFMRRHGFLLFDLSRYHVRRGGLDAGVPTRGQLLWGHALYLHDDGPLPSEAACRLGVVATLAGVPDYAHAVFERIQGAARDATLRERIQRVLDLMPRGFAAPDDSPLGASRHKTQWKD